MKAYLDLLAKILDTGVRKSNRTGIDTIDLFGERLEVDLAVGFPLLTTKKVWMRGIVEELLWFVRGDSNVRSLQAKGVHIWDAWADDNGDLGPVYGAQWRRWPMPNKKVMSPGHWGAGYIDQLVTLLQSLVETPDSRRHIVTAWNPGELYEMKLPPCHCFFQCDITEGKLSLQMYQRSADFFIGVPFNIASYALLTHMLAAATGLEVGNLSIVYGSAHIYVNHLEQVTEQLLREPRPLPRLVLPALPPGGDRGPRACEYFFGLTAADIRLEGYDPHPALPAKVAV